MGGLPSHVLGTKNGSRIHEYGDGILLLSGANKSGFAFALNRFFPLPVFDYHAVSWVNRSRSAVGHPRNLFANRLRLTIVNWIWSIS